MNWSAPVTEADAYHLGSQTYVRLLTKPAYASDTKGTT